MRNEVTLTIKPVHEANGYFVMEVTEIIDGIQQTRYQLMDASDKPVTSRCSSLQYVMSIYKSYTG